MVTPVAVLYRTGCSSAETASYSDLKRSMPYARIAVGSRMSVYLGSDGSHLPRHGIVRVPPDIVVEVVSPSPRDEWRDRIEKMDEYAAFGVRYYWILDPSLQSLEVFELLGGRYTRAARATEGRMDPVPGCRELMIELDALWEQFSRLGPSYE